MAEMKKNAVWHLLIRDVEGLGVSGEGGAVTALKGI